MSVGDVLSFITTAQVWAAGGAEHHAPPISDVIFPALNFLIYAFIIVKFALPPVRDFLKTRREEVMTTIAQASAKKQAAEALVGDYKAKIAGLGKEVQSMQASLREEGEREMAKLLNDAATIAAKIKEDARFLADQEVKMAQQQVREDMANRAEATARGLVQRNMSTADQNRLAEDFIRIIGQAR